MKIQKVIVAGSGVLGSQIAFQIAFHGYKVMVYDVSDESLERAKTVFKRLAKAFEIDLNATVEQIEKTFENLDYSSNLEEAVKDADLLIESIPENLSIKIDFYKELQKVAPKKTIFTTNSSTLLPSQFAEATGRPSKFLALHFANHIWKHNTAEIMGYSGTSPEIFDIVTEFAGSIGMVTLPLYKEQKGYILNSLLVPLLAAATELLVKEVADFETIDKTWMIGTGSPAGPCAFIDVIGIKTVYNINKMAAEETKDPLKIKVVEYFKNNFIDKGKLGVETGEGFYKYPNPRFKEPDFLK